MLKINNSQMKEALNNSNDEVSLGLIRKNLRRQFRGLIPRNYGIFPQDVKVYRMSKSICIELPSWGSYGYRLALLTLEKELYKSFVCDTQYYDGKTTFVVRKCKI